jgi:hypothetical protein
MKAFTFALGATALAIAIGAVLVTAQQPQGPQPFSVGNRLGLPINPAADGAFNPMSSNVKVYGAIYSAESCSYDPVRNLIVVPNRSVGQDVQTNNGWVSFINHDGSVHGALDGVQNAGARANMTPPLILNEPSGSDIANGMFYVSDRDGGTSPSDPLVAVIRWFNMTTGAPAGEIRVPRSAGFNDIEVADDGTICATNTGTGGQTGPDDLAGRNHEGRQRVGLRQGARSVSRTASPSTSRATSSSSTSAQRGADVFADCPVDQDGECGPGR